MNDNRKINLDLSIYLKKLSLLIPGLTLTALIGSYIYVEFFLESFHINASDYFSFNDYVSCAIGPLIWGALCASFPLTLEFLTRHKPATKDIKENLGKGLYYSLLLLLIISVFYFLISLLIQNLNGIYRSFMIMVGSGTPFICQFINTYIENHRQVTAIAFAIILFITGILGASAISAAAIRNSNTNHVNLYKPDLSILEPNVKIITGNPQYLFIYNTQTKNASILRRESVYRIDILKN